MINKIKKTLFWSLKYLSCIWLLTPVITYAHPHKKPINPFKKNKTYDLLEVYKLALKQDPQLKIYKYQATGPDSVASQLQSAKGALFPSVTASSKIATNNKIDIDYLSITSGSNISLNLTQPLVDLSIWHNYNAAKYSLLAANTAFKANKQTLIKTIATAYFQLLEDQDQVNLQQQTVKQQAELYRVSKLNFQVGLKPITDFKAAESQYTISKTILLANENTVIADKRALQALINVYPEKIAIVKKNIKPVTPQPQNLNYWTQQAYKKNPNLKSQQFTLNNTQETYQASRAERYLPTLDLNGSASLQNKQNTIFSGPYTNNYSASIQLSFNLFNLPLNSAVDFDKVAEQNQLYTMIQTKKEIQKDVSDAYRNIQFQITEIKAQKQAIASSELSYKAVLAGYKVGTQTITAIQDSLTQLSQARLNESQAKYAYINAWINFKETVGTLSMTDIVNTNRLLTK